jgi:hypothetical protein
VHLWRYLQWAAAVPDARIEVVVSQLQSAGIDRPPGLGRTVSASSARSASGGSDSGGAGSDQGGRHSGRFAFGGAAPEGFASGPAAAAAAAAAAFGGAFGPSPFARRSQPLAAGAAPRPRQRASIDVPSHYAAEAAYGAPPPPAGHRQRASLDLPPPSAWAPAPAAPAPRQRGSFDLPSRYGAADAPPAAAHASGSGSGSGSRSRRSIDLASRYADSPASTPAAAAAAAGGSPFGARSRRGGGSDAAGWVSAPSNAGISAGSTSSSLGSGGTPRSAAAGGAPAAAAAAAVAAAAAAIPAADPQVLALEQSESLRRLRALKDRLRVTPGAPRPGSFSVARIYAAPPAAAAPPAHGACGPARTKTDVSMSDASGLEKATSFGSAATAVA